MSWEADCKIEVWPPRESQGGQVVGMGPNGVRVCHQPTGTTAIATHARSQHLNRRAAMAMVEYGLLDLGWPLDLVVKNEEQASS